MRSYRFAFTLAILIAIALLGPGTLPALALEPNQILLVVNRNVPESAKLADLYCQLRKIPPDRIASLDLPDSVEMPFDTYETQVVAPLRAFMTDHGLRNRVKCLVTFYGVPLRIASKINTPAEQDELKSMQARRDVVVKDCSTNVVELEKQATALDSSFQPGTGESMDNLYLRSHLALAVIAQHIERMSDPSARSALVTKLQPVLKKLGGLAEVDSLVGAEYRDDSSDPQRQAQWESVHENIRNQIDAMADWQTHRWDPDARANLRKTAADYFGLIAEGQTLNAEINYLTTTDTGAAVDSELAMLWTNYYPRQHWIMNPLYWRSRILAPHTLMVMRLDAPEPAIVEKLMQTSVEVEKNGLHGKIALDARGLSPIDDNGRRAPLGIYDQKIRDLAKFLQSKTDLQVKLDDEAGVFSPHTVDDVALYCGWYSLAHYVPGCDFNPGAVGFHVTSYELVTLHNEQRRWVAGLLRDGVVGTLGAVAEPDLAAFPDPQDFFPLLLTGKYSLAEVYWKTSPTASWMMDCIGDPLYTPYKAHPVLKIEDLPDALRSALKQ